MNKSGSTFLTRIEKFEQDKTKLDPSKLDKSVLGGGTIDTTALLGNLGTLHMSPNKVSDKHKAWPILGDEISPPSNVVPEPSSILVWSLLGAVGLVAGLRRLRKRLCQ